jgi:hypothetical protein
LIAENDCGDDDDDDDGMTERNMDNVQRNIIGMDFFSKDSRFHVFVNQLVFFFFLGLIIIGFTKDLAPIYFSKGRGSCIRTFLFRCIGCRRILY